LTRLLGLFGWELIYISKSFQRICALHGQDGVFNSAFLRKGKNIRSTVTVIIFSAPHMGCLFSLSVFFYSFPSEPSQIRLSTVVKVKNRTAKSKHRFEFARYAM
jgi:hypothetical protein